MSENDDDDLGPCGSICERAEVIRGIAADLETKNNKDARRLLIQAGETVLLHMRPPSASVVSLVPTSGKPAKERPL